MMMVNNMLKNMMKGLTLHFLHQKSIEEAIKEGRKAGIPEELLESLPGMMFNITSAACAVKIGKQTLSGAAKQITAKALASGNAQAFSSDDVLRMIQMTLAFSKDLSRDGGEDRPLPALNEPWFLYQNNKPTGGTNSSD